MTTNRISVRGREGGAERGALKRNLLACASIAACAAFASLPASAQTTAPSNGTTAQTNGDQIETVTVTARKREESIQDVPLSVATISGEQLDRTGVVDMTALTNSLPNFQIVTATSSNNLATLDVRGIPSNVRDGGFSPSVAFYEDDVYLGQPMNFDQDLLDMQRVELLLGPQGTLFGQNTIGGVVSLVTNKPVDDYEAQIEGSIGNYDYRNVQGYVNMPLVGDNLVARIAASETSREGYQDNIYNGLPQGDLNRQEMRAELLGDYEQTEVLLTGEFQNAHERPSVLQYIAEGCTAGVCNNYQSDPSKISQNLSTSVNQRDGLTAHITHHFSDGSELISVTGWRHTFSDDVIDQDYASSPLLESNVYDNEREDILSQEFRYESDQNQAFRYMVGINAQTDYIGVDRTYDYLPPLVILGPLGALHFQIRANSGMNTRTYSGFGDVQYDIMKNLTLDVGVRETSDFQDERFTQNEYLMALGGITSEALAKELLGPSATGILIANAPPDFEKRNETDPSGTATATYHFDDDKLVYLRYARGTKAGGFELEPLPDPVPTDRAFKGEKMDALEVGTKTEWFDKHLLLDGDVFYEDYMDLQIADVLPVYPVGYTHVIRNVGRVTNKGAELSATAIPIDGLKLTASYGYAEPIYGHFIANSGANLTGTALGGAPKWNADLSATYSYPVVDDYVLSATFDAQLRGRRLLGFADTLLTSVAGYTVLNANMTLTPPDSRWEASIWANNLANALYTTAYNNGSSFYGGADLVAFGLPRMYGLTLKYHFGGG